MRLAAQATNPNLVLILQHTTAQSPSKIFSPPHLVNVNLYILNSRLRWMIYKKTKHRVGVQDSMDGDNQAIEIKNK